MSIHRFGRVHLRSADVYTVGNRIIRADSKDIVFTEQDLHDLFDAYRQVSAGQAYALLSDARTPSTLPDSLADLRSKLEEDTHRIANAIVINSYWYGVLHNMNLSRKLRSKIPCRYFSDLEKAMEWLTEQVAEYERKAGD